MSLSINIFIFAFINPTHDIGETKFIYVKDLKTSPNWCPRRIKL